MLDVVNAEPILAVEGLPEGALLRGEFAPWSCPSPLGVRLQRRKGSFLAQGPPAIEPGELVLCRTRGGLWPCFVVRWSCPAGDDHDATLYEVASLSCVPAGQPR